MFAIQAFVLLIAFLIFTEAMKPPTCPPARNGSRCYLDYRTMDLWCDETRFTTIPNPAEITAYAPPELSLSLFFNASCLTTLTKGELSQYPYLVIFDASNNLLKITEPAAFESCPKLNTIILSNNYITYIHQGSFKGLQNLEVLDLSGNRLTEIQPGVFKNLQALVTLRLGHNHLKHLTAKLFSGLPQLRTLSLTHNHLKEWPRSDHTVLMELEVLELDHNRITKIAYFSLEGLASLKKLRLNNNKLQTIDERSFIHSPALEHIDLRNNKLHSLDSNLFSNLCQLRSLLLGGNKLITPHKEWFSNMMLNHDENTDQLMTFGMQENPWKCDCYALDYSEFLQTARNKTQKAHLQEMIENLEIKCSSPIIFTNMHLTDITELEIAVANECNVTRQQDTIHSAPCGSMLRSQQNQPKVKGESHGVKLLRENVVKSQEKISDPSRSFSVIWIGTIAGIIVLVLAITIGMSWLAKNYKTRGNNWSSINTVLTKA